MNPKKILYFLLTHFPNLGIIRFLVTLERPKFLVQLFLRIYFVKNLKVNLSEAEKIITEYKNTLDFFTRKLKPNARPIEQGPKKIISPVDARILQSGAIKKNMLIQAKGKEYQLEEFVGEELASHFIGGQFITLYLSPRDYHRIHHPCDGEIDQVSYFPGNLYPVNPFSLNNFNKVFARNKRLIVSYKHSSLKLLSCWVGALNVGSLNVGFDTSFYSTSQKNIDKTFKQKYLKKDYQMKVEKGGDAGCFELGSTVILLFEAGKVKLKLDQDFICLGEEIAEITH